MFKCPFRGCAVPLFFRTLSPNLSAIESFLGTERLLNPKKGIKGHLIYHQKELIRFLTVCGAKKKKKGQIDFKMVRDKLIDLFLKVERRGMKCSENRTHMTQSLKYKVTIALKEV